MVGFAKSDKMYLLIPKLTNKSRLSLVHLTHNDILRNVGIL